MALEIRKATPEDCGILLSLIRELAAYEKLEHEVTATELTLRESLFSDTPHSFALLGSEQNQVVAFALYFFNFSTFLGRKGLFLEDLFVKPEHRGKGFGKMLLKHLARNAVTQNCGRMEWSVLDWNTPAIGFYRKIGARPLEDWTIYRLTGRSLEEFAREP